MRGRSKRSARAAALLLVVGAVAAVSSFGSTTARAEPLELPRTLTVTPATGLGNQVVLARWTGFTPTIPPFTNSVTLLQCKFDPKVVDADRLPATVDDCLTATPFPNQGNKVSSGFTQADGTGSAYVEILPAARQPLLNCSASNPCTLLAYENNGVVPPVDSLPATAATAPLDFAKSIDDCPPITNFDLRAEGEASASALVYSWAANLCTAKPPLVLDYTETSSVSGREDFLGRLVDAGVTSMPPTTSELAAAAGYPHYTYAPIDLTAVAVAYNITDSSTKKRITDLVLSPRLLARLITDTDLSGPESNPAAFWADPELKRLNPNHHWPTQAVSQPLIRAERNADTYFVTDWIAHDTTAERFLHGDDPDGIAVNSAYQNIAYPTDIFQNLATEDAGYLPLQGERSVARKMFYAVKPAEVTSNDTTRIGFIGVVDLPTAQRYDMPVARLVNGSGDPAGVAPDAAGLDAGFKAMTTNADGVTKAPNFASTDPAAYPLVKIDYAMVPTEVSSATVQANLKRLLTFVGGAGQAALPVGYTPLPADLVAQDVAAAAKITFNPNSPPPPPPPTTPPPTTPVAPSTYAPVTPFTDLGTISANGSDPGSSDLSTTPGASTPVAKTSAPKHAKAAKLSRAKPVVDLANAGERFGLPVIAMLALLGGLYPLSRRARPVLGNAFSALRTRLRRPGRSRQSRLDRPAGSAP